MHGGVWEECRITALSLRVGQAVILPALDVATHPSASSPHFSRGSQHAIGHVVELSPPLPSSVGQGRIPTCNKGVLSPSLETIQGPT